MEPFEGQRIGRCVKIVDGEMQDVSVGRTQKDDEVVLVIEGKKSLSKFYMTEDVAIAISKSLHNTVFNCHGRY